MCMVDRAEREKTVESRISPVGLEQEKNRARRIILGVWGTVQGVGFRPFVYRLAKDFELQGFVRNNMDGVEICIEGQREEIDGFINSLFIRLPSLAWIEGYTITDHPPEGRQGFSIVDSDRRPGLNARVVPDMVVCPHCLEEFYQLGDRRQGYPFITCTYCGPRYSIINSLPYDRPNTSMEPFPMCQSCLNEYRDPNNRRFHAQTNGCPDCGPTLTLYRSCTPPIKGTKQGIPLMRQGLKQGKILALKGVGGYQLVCSPFLRETVERLRRAKGRPTKPLALMVKDLQTLNNYCWVSEEEKNAITHWSGPIVLLQPKGETQLASNIAPHSNRLGMMLPTSPLHHLLFDEEIECLIVTSGNPSGFPIVYQDEDAFRLLDPMADDLAYHDRTIINPCDDSVVEIVNQEIMVIRRARGYAPQPLRTNHSSPPLLSLGGDRNNTFCLGRGEDFFISPYLGNMDNSLMITRMEQVLYRYIQLTEIDPQAVICDLHPNYQTRIWGERYTKQKTIPLYPIQHHHSHMVSCMGEHGLSGSLLGVVCDGTGFGLDGNLWGLEFFAGDEETVQRLGHLQYAPMPGGERAIEYPGRMLAGHLFASFGDYRWEQLPQWKRDFGAIEMGIIRQQLERSIHTPLTSSCGRLFDAVAYLLDLCPRSTYDGEPAIRLEQIVTPGCPGSYSFDLNLDQQGVMVGVATLWEQVWQDYHRGVEPGIIGTKFHNGLIQMIVEAVLGMRQITGLNRVVISGGCFQNRYLLEGCLDRLRDNGFEVYSHKKIPTNDGGLSLGQAMIGAALVRRDQHNVPSLSS